MSPDAGKEILERVLGAADRTNYFLSNLNLREHPWSILDIILVAILFYWAYLLLKETKAMRILYGIAILAVIMLIGKLLHLETLNFILRYVLAALVIAIPVLFQPELRSALERLGRGRFVSDFVQFRRLEIQDVVNHVVAAAEVLAQNKTGAIMVLVRQTGLRDIIQKGIRIDAPVNKELLVSIFAPKTPLHDGAVVIDGSKIVAARCWLPLGDIELAKEYGARHRSAVALSTETDAIVLVCSEERGVISLAVNGGMTTNLSTKQLKDLLAKLLQHKIEGVTS